MKTSLYTLMLSAFIISAAQTSSTAHTLVKIVKANKLNDEERNVSGFKGVSSSGSYNVKITMGNKESLRLEGDEEMIKEIETVVEDGILKIKNKKNSDRIWRSLKGKVNIYITAKTLNSVTLSGSGDISVNGVVKASRLTNTLSGSGSISMSADAEEYIGTISGSGEMEISGTADKANVTIAGSGDFEGRNFKTSEAQIKVSGSGNVSIGADQSLNAVVSGSGNILYSGNPKVSKTKSGSGNISQL
ncbi:DUF2807 domain-containing protein [Flavihumibacter sp. R14]|nr:DUF2807 domain-containing protein [Flavihumibacter soli]